MKKVMCSLWLFQILFIFLSVNLNAQIKVHDDNHISIGSLTKGGGLQLTPDGQFYFQPPAQLPYSWLMVTYSLNAYAKNYIVDYGGSHKFFVYGNGNVYANGVWLGSDSTFKKDIIKMDNALLKIKKLEGVSYQLKQETKNPKDELNQANKYIDSSISEQLKLEESRRHIGLIAQEVEKVFPEAVRTMSDGTKAVAYTQLIAVCIEAIKELNLKVEELEAVIKSNGESEKLQINNDFKSNTVILPKLYQNAPNPFTEKTVIKYVIPENVQKASILIFNMQGTLMKSYDNLSNKRELTINGGELEAGMYMYSLIVDGKEVDTKKMILSK